MLKPVISMHFINCRVLSTSATDLGFVFNHLVYGYRWAAVLQPHIGPTLSAITLILYACAKMYVYTYVSQGERVNPQSPYNVYRLSSILIYSSLFTYV